MQLPHVEAEQDGYQGTVQEGDWALETEEMCRKGSPGDNLRGNCSTGRGTQEPYPRGANNRHPPSDPPMIESTLEGAEGGPYKKEGIEEERLVGD